MTKLKPINRKELVRKLKALGWEGPFPGGNHEYMTKDNKRLVIPNVHGGKDIPVGVLKAIIRQMGIDRDTFINS